MKAVKGNKEYNIDENQKKAYQDAGFDIFSDAGEVIGYGRGKTVSYDEYMKLKAALEADNEELRTELKAAQLKLEHLDAEEKPKTPKKAGE